MRERPPITIGLIAAVIIGLALSVVSYVLVNTIRTQAIGPGLAFTAALLAVALSLMGLWVYGLVELLTLHYVIDRNGITLATAFARQTIPHAAIQQVVDGESASAPSRLRGMTWPGYMRGTLSAEPFGLISVWATEPLPRQLVLVTDSACYGISPANRERFLTNYAMRRDLGALELIPQELTRVGMASWSIWRDRLVWVAIALSLALDAVLATISLARYSALPAIIPLHWNAQGQADRLAPKSGIFALPAIGVGVLVLSLVLAVAIHHQERFGARLLAWGSIGVQAALWTAAWQILGT